MFSSFANTNSSCKRMYMRQKESSGTWVNFLITHAIGIRTGENNLKMLCYTYILFQPNLNILDLNGNSIALYHLNWTVDVVPQRRSR